MWNSYTAVFIMIPDLTPQGKGVVQLGISNPVPDVAWFIIRNVIYRNGRRGGNQRIKVPNRLECAGSDICTGALTALIHVLQDARLWRVISLFSEPMPTYSNCHSTPGPCLCHQQTSSQCYFYITAKSVELHGICSVQILKSAWVYASVWSEKSEGT